MAAVEAIPGLPLLGDFPALYRRPRAYRAQADWIQDLVARSPRLSCRFRAPLHVKQVGIGDPDCEVRRHTYCATYVFEWRVLRDACFYFDVYPPSCLARLPDGNQDLHMYIES